MMDIYQTMGPHVRMDGRQTWPVNNIKFKVIYTTKIPSIVSEALELQYKEY